MANKTITDFTEVTTVGGTDEYETMQSGVTFKGTVAKLAAYLATLAQTLTNKTLTTPTIGSFANAAHDHSNAAGGGTLNASAIGAGTLAEARGGTGAATVAAAVSGATLTALAVTGPITTTPIAISASDIDFSSGTLRDKTLAANTTFTFSNPVEGRGITVKLYNNATSYTVTWPTVRWLGGANPPVQSANAMDVYTFIYWGGEYIGTQVPGNVAGYEQEAYAAGTVYSLTNTAALLDFGTTDPSITVTSAGTYMIYWGCTLKYNAATFAGNQTATAKVRRTNNTAADLANATLTETTRIITTTTDTLGTFAGKPVKYTATAGDILQVWGSLSATPAAGSVDATDAWIIIVRIA